MSSKWAIHFKSEMHDQLFESIKDYASSLYTTGIQPNNALCIVRKQSV